MLFGLFAKKSVEVKVRREINFKIDYTMTQKEIEKQLKKIVENIEDETGLKATIKKSYVTSLGAKLNSKSCKSLVAWVDFDTMTEKKEDSYDAKNRVNHMLNDIDENTRKFNIAYLE